MKLSPQQKIAAFVLTALAVVVIVVSAIQRARATLAGIHKLEVEFGTLDSDFKSTVRLDAKNLEGMQTQYSELAAHVTRSLEELNNSLTKFASQNDQRELVDFWFKSLELKKWLDAQEATVMQVEFVFNISPTTLRVNVKQSVRDIERAYDTYLASARTFSESLTTNTEPNVRLDRFTAVQKSQQQVLLQANRANAYADAIRLSLNSSREWFPKTDKRLSDLKHDLRYHLTQVQRRMILASVASAIGLLVLLVAVSYKVWVSPLRHRLRESDATIERQKKIAQKGQTAAELAHELRNPLTAIGLRVYSLQKALFKGTGEEQDAAVIRKELRKLNAVLEEFLQLDQAPQLHFVSLSATEALREARDLMEPQLAAQGIELKLETTDDLQLMADSHLLQQVLINLIKNAAESIERNGVITLRARPDTAEIRRRPAKVVVIEVQDTGGGIPAEVQERLFDPFFTTKTEKGGTGLGLSVVERNVERHRGILDFETKLGEGTTFRIVLPVEQET